MRVELPAHRDDASEERLRLIADDPEDDDRSKDAATARGVARLLATVIVLGVAVVLALHAFVVPGLDTAPTASVGARVADADAREVPSLGRRRAAFPRTSGASYFPTDDGHYPVFRLRASLGKSDKRDSATLGQHHDHRSHHHHRRDASSSPAPTDWVTPTYLISLPGQKTEEDRLEANLVKLVQAHGVAAVSANIRLVPGVDPNLWPKGIDRAVYGLKTVFELLGGDYLEPDFNLIANLPWIKSLAARNDEGRIAPPWDGQLTHHVGCLFAHMAQWQLAKDAGNEHTYLLESDGLNPSLLAIPVGSLGSVARNAPRDYDIVIVNQPLFTGGELFSRFEDKDGNAIEMRRWRQGGVAGLGAYLFSDRFVEKIFKHVAERGADMVDAWLLDRMCSHDSLDENGEFVGFDAPGTVTPALRCYHAVGVQEYSGLGANPNPPQWREGTLPGDAIADVGTLPKIAGESHLPSAADAGALGKRRGASRGARAGKRTEAEEEEREALKYFARESVDARAARAYVEFWAREKEEVDALVAARGIR
jgi:hypothetical protein